MVPLGLPKGTVAQRTNIFHISRAVVLAFLIFLFIYIYILFSMLRSCMIWIYIDREGGWNIGRVGGRLKSVCEWACRLLVAYTRQGVYEVLFFFLTPTMDGDDNLRLYVAL